LLFVSIVYIMYIDSIYIISVHYYVNSEEMSRGHGRIRVG